MFQGTGALAFNAAFYLQTNPDVFQAIQNGTFQGSALDHFVQFGQFEGRDPNAFFDTEYYLANNTDVLVAIADPANPSVTSAFQHFVMFGSEEGVVRAPSAQFEGFTEAAYLAANPDVAAAVAAGQFANGFEHFLTFGVNEVRAGSGVTVDPNPGLPGETFAFTVGVDQLVGTANNDTFTGVVGGAAPTFQAGDQVNGAGGVDRLNLTALTAAGGAGPVAGTIVDNVEQVFVRGLAATTLDATLWTGVNQLWSDRSLAAGDITFTGVQEAATLGLNNTAGDLTVNFVAGALAADSTVSVVANSSTSTLTVNSATAAALTGIALTATGENEIDLVSNATAIETLTIDGAGSVELTGSAGSLDDLTTVDASANKGGVDIDLSTNAEDVTITGGSGDDRFVLGANFDKNDTVDGGAGFDTVVVAGANFSAPGAAAPFNALTSIERVEFVGGPVTLQGSTFTNATITNLLFNGGDATILNAGSARTYEYGSDFTGDTTLQLKTTATTLNVDLLGDEGAVADGTTIDELTVEYAAGTTATAVTTLNIGSLGGLADGDVNTIGSIEVRNGSTIVITGDSELEIDALVAGGGTGAGLGFTIDASGFAADLTIASGADGDDFILGTTGDTEITFGAGSSGEVVAGVGAAPDDLTNFDVVTGFTAGAGGDVLDQTGSVPGTAGFAAVDAATQDDINANATTLLEAFEIATAGVDGDWTAFTFGTETYVAYNEDGAVPGAGGAPGTPDSFEVATDLIVQLNGVTVADLTVDNFA